MNFVRGRDPHEVLGIGLATLIPNLMKDSNWNHEDYYEVIMWSLEEINLDVFRFMISLHGKIWEGERVDIRKGVHDYLWNICNMGVYGNVNEFMKSLFNIPDLFEDPCMDLGHKHIHHFKKNPQGRYIGSDGSKCDRIIYYGLGFYTEKCRQYNNTEGELEIIKYYNKYKKNDKTGDN